MDLSKALEYLVGIGAEKGKGQTFQTPAEPKHVYYLNGPDGTDRIEADPPPNDHTAADLETVVALAADGETDKSIWYSRSGVVARNGPRDRATFRLTPSPQLAKLLEWERTPGILKQTALILSLRTLFADCYPDHPTLLESVRRIDVKKGQEAAAEVRQGKVSMSRSMLAEMTGLDKIPETVTFKVPVFAEQAFVSYKPVRVALDADPQAESFTLIPVPGDVEKAYSGAEDELQTRLAALIGDEKIKLYHGSPCP